MRGSGKKPNPAESRGEPCDGEISLLHSLFSSLLFHEDKRRENGWVSRATPLFISIYTTAYSLQAHSLQAHSLQAYSRNAPVLAMAFGDDAIGAALTEEAAATMVQAIVRGGSERKERQKEVKAATTVQAHLKGGSLRRSMTASNVRAVSSRVSFTAADGSARKLSMPKSLTRGKTLSGLFAGGNLAASKVAPIDRKPPSCTQRLNDNWGLFKSMAHLRLLLVILWAAVVVAIKEHLVDEFTEDEDEVFGLLSSPASRSGVGVLGSLLAFALVFRTSICYARWWEARRLPSPGLPVPTRAASATPPQPPSPRTCPHTARTPPLPRLPPSACAAGALPVGADDLRGDQPGAADELLDA
jgi:hypothetical protein